MDGLPRISITLPPHILKMYPSEVFLETGTFDGRAIQMAMDLRCFERYVGIETDTGLAAVAAKRFETELTVRIIHGDSLEVLAGILDAMRPDTSVTFWLDAHIQDAYTYGKTAVPLIGELQIIKAHLKNKLESAVLVDDRRLMGFKNSPWAKITPEIVIQSMLDIDPSWTHTYHPNNVADNDIIAAFSVM